MPNMPRFGTVTACCLDREGRDRHGVTATLLDLLVEGGAADEVVALRLR